MDRIRRAYERSINKSLVTIKSSVCPICGKDARLERHHWVIGEDVYIALICHKCNRLLGDNDTSYSYVIHGLSNSETCCPECHKKVRLHHTSTINGNQIYVKWRCMKCSRKQ